VKSFSFILVFFLIPPVTITMTKLREAGVALNASAPWMNFDPPMSIFVEWSFILFLHMCVFSFSLVKIKQKKKIMVFGVYLRMGPPSETYPASYPTPTLTPSPAGHPNEQNTMWSTPSGYVKKYGHADGVIISSVGGGGMVDDGGFRMVCHPYVTHLLQGGSGVLVIHGRRCSGKSTTLWGWIPLLFKSLFEEIGKRPVGTYGVQVSQMDCCRDTITDVIAAARGGGAEGSYPSETTPSPDGSHLLSKRRSSKTLRGGATAGGGARAPSPAAAVVHVMDVQGDVTAWHGMAVPAPTRNEPLLTLWGYTLRAYFWQWRHCSRSELPGGSTRSQFLLRYKRGQSPLALPPI